MSAPTSRFVPRGQLLRPRRPIDTVLSSSGRPFPVYNNRQDLNRNNHHNQESPDRESDSESLSVSSLCQNLLADLKRILGHALAITALSVSIYAAGIVVTSRLAARGVKGVGRWGGWRCVRVIDRILEVGRRLGLERRREEVQTELRRTLGNLLRGNWGWVGGGGRDELGKGEVGENVGRVESTGSRDPSDGGIDDLPQTEGDIRGCSNVVQVSRSLSQPGEIDENEKKPDQRPRYNRRVSEVVEEQAVSSLLPTFGYIPLLDIEATTAAELSPKRQAMKQQSSPAPELLITNTLLDPEDHVPVPRVEMSFDIWRAHLNLCHTPFTAPAQLDNGGDYIDAQQDETYDAGADGCKSCSSESSFSACFTPPILEAEAQHKRKPLDYWFQESPISQQLGYRRTQLFDNDQARAQAPRSKTDIDEGATCVRPHVLGSRGLDKRRTISMAFTGLKKSSRKKSQSQSQSVRESCSMDNMSAGSGIAVEVVRERLLDERLKRKRLRKKSRISTV